MEEKLKEAVLAKAYAAGLKDGLAWDLEDFDSIEEVKHSGTGWDEATIQAVGISACSHAWGIPPNEDGDEIWGATCEAYNRGAHEGATAPQEERTGLAPKAQPTE